MIDFSTLLVRRRTALTSIRGVSIALLVLAAMVSSAPSAHAHASLKSITPADGATVQDRPKSVALVFSADIADNVRRVALLSPSGRPIEHAWKADGTTITVTTPKSMDNGTWSVQWRVLGGDGHPLTGSTTFVLAATPPPSAEPAASHSSSSESTTAQPADAEPSSSAHAGHVAASTYPHTELRRLALVGRIMFFGGLLLFVGGLIFAIVAAPGWRPRFWRPMLTSVVIGAWLVLGTHVAMLDERSPAAMLNPLAWFRDMLSVGVRGYVLAAALTLMIHALRWQLEPREWEARNAGRPMLLLGLALAAAAAPALSGHAADGTMLWLRIPVDMLHVLAGATWLGGLVQVLTIAVRERSLDPRMHAVINRYSSLAAVSVVVIVVTGVYATFNEMDAGLGELVGSTWGRLVLLKILLLAATMPLANANRLRNVPGISHDPIRNVPLLRRFVAIELIIIVWVIAATSLLVYETPPTPAAATAHATMAK